MNYPAKLRIEEDKDLERLYKFGAHMMLCTHCGGYHTAFMIHVRSCPWYIAKVNTFKQHDRKKRFLNPV